MDPYAVAFQPLRERAHGCKHERELLFVMTNVCRFIRDLRHQDHVIGGGEVAQCRDVQAELVVQYKSQRVRHFLATRQRLLWIGRRCAVSVDLWSRTRMASGERRRICPPKSALRVDAHFRGARNGRANGRSCDIAPTSAEQSALSPSRRRRAVRASESCRCGCAEVRRSDGRR